MIGVDVTIKSNKLPAIKAHIVHAVARSIAKAAHDIVAHAIAAVPVLTGYLKNSIQAVMLSAWHWVVRVGASYGIYIEMGTRYMRARPFLFPAYERVIPQMLLEIKRQIEGSGSGSVGGSGLVSYTTKSGATRQATAAQVAHWTRGAG